MLFSRREKDNLPTRVRLAFWPRRNHARSTRYVVKRIMRIRATPHAIAAGVACGAFASFTPLMGFHFILSFALAWVLRGSMIAAALGTAVGNPLTFPLIWTTTLGTGRWMLGTGAAAHSGESFGVALAQSGLLALWEPFVKPMLIGGLPWGLACGLVLYWMTRGASAAFQAKRAEKRQYVLAVLETRRNDAAQDRDASGDHDQFEQAGKA